MSLITKAFKPKIILQLVRTLDAASTKQCHWFPDYKPGPHPKTKEEREAAAKKYNLLPEEYEPYPDDGNSVGDYPKLPIESVDSKDHNEIYDFVLLRRNYMEPVPKEQIILLPEMLSTIKRKITYAKELIMFLCFVVVCLTIFISLEKIIIVPPLMAEQRPTPGVVHYTFELDHERKNQRSAPVKQIRSQEQQEVRQEVEKIQTVVQETEDTTETKACQPK